MQLIEDNTISSEYIDASDTCKRNADKSRVTINLTDMGITGNPASEIINACKLKISILGEPKDVLVRLFIDFKNPIFKAMEWVDQKDWVNDNKTYGIEAIREMTDHFAIPLSHVKFNVDTAIHEWKSCQ